MPKRVVKSKLQSNSWQEEMAEMAEQEEIVEQDQKFDCPDNFQGSEHDRLYYPERYDDNGVIRYYYIEERDRFPCIPGQFAPLTVAIQTDDYFNIPQYLWENFRLYKPKAKEDDDYYRYPNRKYNKVYQYKCCGYFNEPGK